MKFEELEVSERIVRSLKELGFEEMFPIQTASIGLLFEGRDVIGQAKTGTGKTAAFGIPMLQKISTQDDSVQGLVLVPTRELAQQVAEALNTYGKYLNIKALAVYGGVPVYDQMEQLQHTVHIIVGTPGRVIDHLSRGTLLFDRIKMVVLGKLPTTEGRGHSFSLIHAHCALGFGVLGTLESAYGDSSARNLKVLYLVRA